MFGQMMCLGQHQTQELEVTGGATQSVFPLVEEWLMSDTHNQELLHKVASRKQMDNYRSMVDFLLCEVCTEYRYPCKKFYNDEGPRFAKMADIDTIAECEVKILKVLYYALVIEKKGFVFKPRTWTDFVEEAQRFAA